MHLTMNAGAGDNGLWPVKLHQKTSALKPTATARHQLAGNDGEVWIRLKKSTIRRGFPDWPHRPYRVKESGFFQEYG
jgi:hypothetical protein